ncbi:MAG: hypothetical protein JXA22_07215 [Candidatus Thermoplasmatota archaeon]|nr:hypothetical protein [Candidatus Thermoplasmatota archaeon]
MVPFVEKVRGRSMRNIFQAFFVLLLLLGTLAVLPEHETIAIHTRAPDRTLYVAPLDSTYTRIRDALIDASEGDTILVAPGTYEEGMIISTDGINVKGNISEGEVILILDPESVVLIDAGNVTMSGFVLHQDGEYISVMVISSTNNVTISDIEINSNGTGEGLYMREVSNVSITNITIRSGDYAAVRFRGSSDITIDDFSFSCNSSLAGCVELDGVDDLILKNGSIELRGGGTSIYDLAGGDLDLFDIHSIHTEKFIMMETGSISMYNMDIDPADILMDFPDPSHTVRSYYLRDIIVNGEMEDGSIEPLEGAELNVTTDDEPVYSTPYFGGSDPVSGSDGKFGQPFPFLSWELKGGSPSPRSGTSRIDVSFTGDRTRELEHFPVDANTTDDILFEFTDIFDQVRAIRGWVTYLDGPMMGQNATNATIHIISPNMTEVANATVNGTGLYEIEGLHVGVIYTIVVVPEFEVVDGGSNSGYIRTETTVNLTDDIFWDPAFAYWWYIPPTAGPIFGYVRYLEGPKDGVFCGGAEVDLYNLTGELSATTTTDNDGHYMFEDVPFGEGYEIRVTPPLEELGTNLQITGYLVWDGSAFTHNGSTRINASLKYYEHVEPTIYHPDITIIDENGRPVEGVVVEVSILGATYKATTNDEGIALFEDLDMADFPSGATFKASREGYDDIEWVQGESVPAMKESVDDPHTWLIILLVIVVIMVLAGAAYIIFVRKGPEEEKEE